MKLKKIIFGLFVFALVLVFALFSNKKLNYSGYVEGENRYLASSRSGHVSKAWVMRGEFVKKNQLLYELDPMPEALLADELRQGVESARYAWMDLKKPKRLLEINMAKEQLEKVQAELDLANLRVKRLTELYQKQAVDKDHLDESISTQHQIQAMTRQSEFNLKLAKMGSRVDQIYSQRAHFNQAKFSLKVGLWHLAQKKIYAVDDGLIYDTYFQEGEWVESGRPVLSLLPLNNIRVEFFVPARDLSQFLLNQKIYFTCEGCQPRNEAIVNFIAPEAEYAPPLIYTRENSDHLVFRIKARIVHPLLFKPGQPVTVMKDRS